MSKASDPVVAYATTRLHFKAAIIEPLAMNDRFRIDTPVGSFEMTKAEFYHDFANVVATRSYRERGEYHSPTVPQKALRYLTSADPSTEIPKRRPATSSSNRRLSQEELTDLFAPLLTNVRERLRQLAGADEELHFALRRKLFKELVYDERSKPMQRRALKQKKIAEQDGKCALCGEELPARGAVMDRFEAMKGYVAPNVRILCTRCDVAEQERKNYG